MLEESTGTQTRVRLPAERKSSFRRRFGPDIAVSAISAFSLKARTLSFTFHRAKLDVERRLDPTPFVSTNQPLRFYRREPLLRCFPPFYRGKSMELLLDFREIPWSTQTCVVNVRDGETLLFPFDNICCYTSQQHIDVNFARRIIIRVL